MADFRDWIPDGEDPGPAGSGFADYVPPREPEVKQKLTPEELKQKRVETLAKAREAKKAKAEQMTE
jgi:hypothetical protein